MQNPQNENYKYTPDIKGYQQAVWDFLLEHSEITESGKVFIKFHTDGQRNFENRVLSRWKYNYHREDPQAKNQRAEDQKVKHQAEQKAKKKKYKADKKARMKAFKKQQFISKLKGLFKITNAKK